MSPLHPIAQYLLIQLVIAITMPIAGVIVAIGLDVAGIGTLLSQTFSPTLGFIAMVAMSISMFAPIIFMTAVMLLAE